jgi:hypothetical protein
MNIPTACTGHVLIDLPIFGGPVLVLGGWLVWTTLRARRDESAGVSPR